MLRNIHTKESIKKLLEEKNLGSDQASKINEVDNLNLTPLAFLVRQEPTDNSYYQIISDIELLGKLAKQAGTFIDFDNKANAECLSLAIEQYRLPIVVALTELGAPIHASHLRLAASKSAQGALTHLAETLQLRKQKASSYETSFPLFQPAQNLPDQCLVDTELKVDHAVTAAAAK